MLHLRTGDVTLEPTECATLRCDPGLASTFAHLRPGMLTLAAVLYGLGTVAWAARWRCLLTLAGVDLALSRVWRLSMEAQAGGILLPGGIGGDALRITSVAARAPNKLTIVVASVLLDRVVGLAVIGAFASSLSFAFGGLRGGALPSVLASLPLGFVVAVVVTRTAPLGRMPWLLAGRIGAVARPVLEYVRHPRAPRAIALAAAMGALVAFTQFTAIRSLIVALGGVPTAEKWIYVGIAVAFVVAALPSLPGAWGTADAVYVFFFGWAGLHATTALGVCLVYRLFWYLSGVIGAFLHFATPSSPAEQVAGAPGPPA